ncbi:MAG: hypothetical protein A2Y33_12425 [Spirochaetes bacterium GWF1_51_8]|nr:MAG: hypothetical protein A2Y33_12425 [Spirochaetes bacterium GWF1_51_8]
MDFVKLMIGWGADINSQEEFSGKTPLYSAIENKHSEIANLLLKYGADPTIHSYYRDYSPFVVAVLNKDFGIAEELLDAGISVNTRCINKFTALHWAVFENNIPAVKFLIENSAAVDAFSSHGFTPLHIAAMTGNAAMIRLLLSAGADPFVKTLAIWDIVPAGSFPADIARLYDHPDIVMLLVTAKKVDKPEPEKDNKKKKKKNK